MKVIKIITKLLLINSNKRVVKSQKKKKGRERQLSQTKNVKLYFLIVELIKNTETITMANQL